MLFKKIQTRFYPVAGLGEHWQVVFYQAIWKNQ